MIPMEYLTAEFRAHERLNPAYKSGSSMNKNRYLSRKAKAKKKHELGPAVVLCLGKHNDDYILGYDRFGKPKKM